MAQVKKGSRVKIVYTGKLKDGTIFETNIGAPPLEFTVGKGKVIKGFENAVIIAGIIKIGHYFSADFDRFRKIFFIFHDRFDQFINFINRYIIKINRFPAELTETRDRSFQLLKDYPQFILSFADRIFV